MGVANVICTETRVHDEAAFTIGVAYAHTLAHTADYTRTGYRRAFEAAVNAVRALTERRVLDGGIPAFTPRFAFIDPDDATLVEQSGPRRGRCRAAAGADAVGRIAAGRWVLLQRWQWDRGEGATFEPLPWPSALRGNKCFAGNERHLDEMFNRFFPILCDAGERLGSAKKVHRLVLLQAISGLGGIGKSELATQYALLARERDSYPAGVVFVSADGAGELEFLRRLARALRLDRALQEETDTDAVRDAVHGWFGERVGWLLFVDNADDEAALVEGGAIYESLPPQTAQGHVLLTSRVGSDVFASMGAEQLTLRVLPPEPAAMVLLQRARKLMTSEEAETTLNTLKEADAGEWEALMWLAGRECLNGLPLALQQAGAYMASRQARSGEPMRFAAYRSAYETQAELIERGPGSDGMLPRETDDERRLRKSVATVWRLSVDALREESVVAAQLFELCAFLDPECIPVTLLARLPKAMARSCEWGSSVEGAGFYERDG